MATKNGLERWRGETTAHLEDIVRRLDELGERFEKALAKHAENDEAIEKRFSDAHERLDNRINGVTTRVALISGALGAMFGGGAHFLSKLLVP